MITERNCQPLALLSSVQYRICFILAQPAIYQGVISIESVQNDRIRSYLKCGDGADATEASVERAGFDGGVVSVVLGLA